MEWKAWHGTAWPVNFHGPAQHGPGMTGLRVTWAVLCHLHAHSHIPSHISPQLPVVFLYQSESPISTFMSSWWIGMLSTNSFSWKELSGLHNLIPQNKNPSCKAYAPCCPLLIPGQIGSISRLPLYISTYCQKPTTLACNVINNSPGSSAMQISYPLCMSLMKFLLAI